MWWKSLKGLRASQYWFHFFKFGILWELVMLVMGYGVLKGNETMYMGIMGEDGSMSGESNICVKIHVQFWCCKSVWWDCFYTNFFEFFWNVVGYGDSVCF